MDVKQIKEIEGLIHLPADQKITGHKVARLTAPGENYGSLMLRVDIAIKTPNGNDEIHAVAKLVPPNEFIQKIFNTPVTFRNEIAFYKTIVPLLQNFQREHGVKKVIDYFPKYYGSRLNLKGGDKVDGDAALVLENLKLDKYMNVDRIEGMDLDVAKLVLTDLAQFHAVPLALKLQKPEVFQKEIMPNLLPWFAKEEGFDTLKGRLRTLIDKLDELKPLTKRILEAFDKMRLRPETRELFGTISHNDCWTNNNMVKFEGKKPVGTKMVDFQICSYGSHAADVVFFLFSSVKSQVLEEHFDDLLTLYHQKFVSVLEELKCDTTPFTFEAFQKELDYEARNTQFGHVVYMLFPIFVSQEGVPEISEFNADNAMSHEPSDLHKQKLVFVINEFVKRNWI